MKIVYLSAAGAADPTRASIPVHLAVNGSAVVGHEPVIVLAGDATDLLRAGAADAVTGLGVPPMRELLAKVRDQELPVYV